MSTTVPTPFELGRLFFHYSRKRSGGKTRYGMLCDLFAKAWSKETASPSCQAAWSPENPAFGQCAVTALCLQDMLGGTLQRCVVEGFGSHYFNHLPSSNGHSVYDLTRSQFPKGTNVPAGDPAERTYVLESPRAAEARTKERYELLKSRLADAMRSA